MGVNAKDPCRPGNSMNEFQGRDRACHIPEEAGCVASLWTPGKGDQHGEGTWVRETEASVLNNFHTGFLKATPLKLVFAVPLTSNALPSPIPAQSSRLRINAFLL